MTVNLLTIFKKKKHTDLRDRTHKVGVSSGIVSVKQPYSGLQKFLGKKKEKINKYEAIGLYMEINKNKYCWSDSDVFTHTYSLYSLLIHYVITHSLHVKSD